MTDTTSEEFYQGYACAMETIEYMLVKKFDIELEWIRKEIAAVDRKIEILRRQQ
jgi:hypothetical protein